jgi:phosphopantothenoylcysteine decarboxylase/phosphopantothenate--cysteine ligase
MLAHAHGKLERKAVDLVVANDVTTPGAGFDTTSNAVTLVSADGAEQVPLQSKAAVAARILDRVESLLAGRPVTQVG